MRVIPRPVGEVPREGDPSEAPHPGMAVLRFAPRVESHHPLSRALAKVALGHGPVVATHGELGVYRSFEDPLLIRLLFTELGCPGGHLWGHAIAFEPGDEMALTSVIHIGFLSAWDILLFGPGERFTIEIGHDGWVALWTVPDLARPFEEAVEGWLPGRRDDMQTAALRRRRLKARLLRRLRRRLR